MSLVIYGLWVLAGIFGAITFLSCFKIVDQQTARVVEVFGKFHKVITPGLKFVPPWFMTSVSAGLSLRVSQIPETVDVKTKDNLFVRFPVKVQYNVDPNRVREAYYELDDPIEQIKAYVFNTVRSECSKMTFDELYTERDKIEKAVQEALKEGVGNYGYIIRNVLVDEPEPSKDVRRAIEAEKVAERQMLAAKHEAEAQRITIEAAAAAEAESKRLQGQGIADMRKAIADGFAQSIADLKGAAGDKINEQMIIDFLLEVQRLDTKRDVAQALGHGNLVIFDESSGNKGSEISNLLAALKASQT